MYGLNVLILVKLISGSRELIQKTVTVLYKICETYSSLDKGQASVLLRNICKVLLLTDGALCMHYAIFLVNADVLFFADKQKDFDVCQKLIS